MSSDHQSSSVIIRIPPSTPEVQEVRYVRSSSLTGEPMTDSRPTRHVIDRLWSEIDRREDEFVETVAGLVRRPSPLGAEAAAQSYVAEHLAASGLAVDVW